MRAQDAHRAAANIDTAPAGLDADLVQEQLHVRLPDASLHPQPLGLGGIR
jgi:hypothetical protein